MSVYRSMEVVSPSYHSVVGLNHFRRVSKKYDTLKPGEIVRILHVNTPGGEPYATEDIEIRAVSRGTFKMLFDAHADNNAGVVHMEKAYGDVGLGDPFIVVHF